MCVAADDRRIVLRRYRRTGIRRHPALKAITPENSYFDFYDALRQGGMLRASLRKESTAPRDNHRLPWHRAYEEDRQPLLPDEIVQLTVPIQPIAYRFNRGNRIRIAILGADKDNTEASPYPDALLSIQVGGDRASHVSLPIRAPFQNMRSMLLK